MDSKRKHLVKKTIRRRVLTEENEDRILRERAKRQAELDRARLEEKKQAMITAMEAHLGVVTTAAKQAGIARQMHSRWYATDRHYRAAIDELAIVRKDFAERKLLELVNAGDSACVRFINRSLNRDRGYDDGQRIEISGPDGEPLSFGAIRHEMPLDAIKAALLELLGGDDRVDAALEKLSVTKKYQTDGTATTASADTK